ncbi:hypothetical protein OF83DRAFT_1178233 [Amylostereum chailletii]|nr:hypothetical protein OF83DRAFT_1178233 [Amylostereum chailletii]
MTVKQGVAICLSVEGWPLLFSFLLFLSLTATNTSTPPQSLRDSPPLGMSLSVAQEEVFLSDVVPSNVVSRSQCSFSFSGHPVQDVEGEYAEGAPEEEDDELVSDHDETEAAPLTSQPSKAQANSERQKKQ